MVNKDHNLRELVSRYHLLTLKVLGSIPAFFGPLCELFWLHILLLKHQVDVVP